MPRSFSGETQNHEVPKPNAQPRAKTRLGVFLDGVAEAFTRPVRPYVNAYLSWEADRLIRRSVKIYPSAVTAYIQEKGSETALNIVLKYLDREGLLHCALCPKRAPLRRVGPYYSCPKHIEAIERKILEGEAKVSEASAPAVKLEPKTAPMLPPHLKVVG